MDKQSSVRESGYYWVRDNDEWMICYFDGYINEWELPGHPTTYSDSVFDEIDEKRIIREE